MDGLQAPSYSTKPSVTNLCGFPYAGPQGFALPSAQIEIRSG
jgi:hypothetical protein